MSLLIQVITSWQVIAITVGLIMYMTLVFYVARIYHRPRSSSRTKIRRRKSPASVISEDADSLEPDVDDLGLGD